jgi:hypothetical protein
MSMELSKVTGLTREQLFTGNGKMRGSESRHDCSDISPKLQVEIENQSSGANLLIGTFACVVLVLVIGIDFDVFAYRE